MAEQSTAASQSIARETATLSTLVGQFDLGAREPARRAPVAAKPRTPALRPLRAAGGGAAAAADWKEF